ncbi:MAG: hypothetical protein MSC31_19550 [Solirubrobacteraceae bacterium MAG38_C4-C5]|nr:hypothetical protein [Candidatus Siliceabacter maunaloa]
MVDSPGDWGALRVVDVTDPLAPTLRGVYQPPESQVFPPPDLGVYSVNHAVARGSTAYVAGHANGVRAVDLTNANPTEIASFVPPDTPDPTNQIPAKANVTGVDVAENGSIVISDVNSGLYVLRATLPSPDPPLPPSPPPPSPPPPSPPPPSPPPPSPPPPSPTPSPLGLLPDVFQFMEIFPAKIEIERARVLRSDRRLDVLAPITARASGEVEVEVFAAQERFGFTEDIDAENRRIRFNRRIPADQADLGTGIMTISYAGDDNTRLQEVRLRAASQKANLALDRPEIVDGRLKVEGTISDRARGIVRLQMQYVVDGETETAELRGRIDDGEWVIDEALSDEVREGIAQRTGTVHSYTLFTGYFERRIRGEMQSFQILGER